jgi:hypothetical protein
MSRCLLLVLASMLAIATMHVEAQPGALFAFHRNAWVNLHHFARAQARGVPVPAQLPEADAKEWAAGVEFYKPYGKRDLLGDEGMVEIKLALRGAEGKTSLDGVAIDAGLKTTLERLMPIYQKHWWPEHDRAHRAWIAALQPLLDRHGLAISQALTRAYETSWPSEPVPVDLSVFAGRYGGYTSSPPTHVTMSSQQPGLEGLAALEMVFHESSHSPVSNLFLRVEQAAKEQNVAVPPQLWHAVLFYTAGELTRRELSSHGIAYTLYGGPELYTNMCGAGCLEKLAEHWAPRLDGKRSFADALSALMVSFK